MQFTQQQIAVFEGRKTPFYFYDMELLQQTVATMWQEAKKYNYHIHYAIKANYQDRILQFMVANGLGADCVSGNEVEKAIEMGFSANDIVFAGVGKGDEEIETALQNDIFCFNCESLAEVEVINTIAQRMDKIAPIALRLNPHIDGQTHAKITTGLHENKFGIDERSLERVLSVLKTLSNINLIGLHFHIGSQITSNEPFERLTEKVNYFNQMITQEGFAIQHLNMGGGLGIDYDNPQENPIVDFKTYFELFNKGLQLLPNQQVHFELGRSIVAQCGSLISRVLYIKQGVQKKFMILDAGMTELIRPAMYEAHHAIEVLNPPNEEGVFDVVGPVCESSEVFCKDRKLPLAKRGDRVAILSAGAYGETMQSNYNLRYLQPSLFSDQI